MERDKKIELTKLLSHLPERVRSCIIGEIVNVQIEKEIVGAKNEQQPENG